MSISKREKIIYSILKEVESNNNFMTRVDYDVDRRMFLEIASFIKDEGLLNNVTISFGDAVKYFEVASITSKGMEYLKKNSNLSKVYRGIKEVKSWIL